MPYYKIFEYKGKKIFYVKLEGELEEEKKVLEEVKKLIEKEPQKSVNHITDATEATFSSEAVEVIKEYAKHNTPYIKNSVIIGITGMKKVVVWGVMKVTGRDFKLLNTVDQAKEWIVNQ